MSQSKSMSTSTSTSTREILSLKPRAETCLVDNYARLFHGPSRDPFLDLIPKSLLKDIFNRLVFKGILELPLLSRIIDQNLVILDLKSVSGLGNSAAELLKGFSGLETLFLNKVVADSGALCTTFSTMFKLSALEITNSPGFDDDVLTTIAECCPCLKILNAASTEISDKGMEAVARNNLSLVALDISGTRVSFLGIEALSFGPSGGSLRELKFSGSGIRCPEDILNAIQVFRNLQDSSLNLESSGNFFCNLASIVAHTHMVERDRVSVPRK